MAKMVQEQGECDSKQFCCGALCVWHTPVQRCTGMALQRTQWRERDVAMGAEAA